MSLDHITVLQQIVYKYTKKYISQTFFQSCFEKRENCFIQVYPDLDFVDTVFFSDENTGQFIWFSKFKKSVVTYLKGQEVMYKVFSTLAKKDFDTVRDIVDEDYFDNKLLKIDISVLGKGQLKAFPPKKDLVFKTVEEELEYYNQKGKIYKTGSLSYFKK